MGSTFRWAKFCEILSHSVRYGMYASIFTSISGISGLWKGEHEGLCAMKCHLGLERISPPAGFESIDPKSGALTARPRRYFLTL